MIALSSSDPYVINSWIKRDVSLCVHNGIRTSLTRSKSRVEFFDLKSSQNALTLKLFLSIVYYGSGVNSCCSFSTMSIGDISNAYL